MTAKQQHNQQTYQQTYKHHPQPTVISQYQQPAHNNQNIQLHQPPHQQQTIKPHPSCTNYYYEEPYQHDHHEQFLMNKQYQSYQNWAKHNPKSYQSQKQY